jgi:DNA-binding NarL/FixJ family response regulator
MADVQVCGALPLGTAATVRVFIVDDSPTARRMLHHMLAQRDGLDVVGEAVSAADCLARVADLVPDVVVMDWQMPGMNGADATRELLARHPRVRVVGFTSGPDESRRAFRDAGAAEVFRKEQALQLREYLRGRGCAA